MAEYVAHQVNGLLFEHRSASSLHEWMRWAVDHPEALAAFGERGYLHSPDGIVPNIVDHCATLERLYNELLPVP